MARSERQKTAHLAVRWHEKEVLVDNPDHDPDDPESDPLNMEVEEWCECYIENDPKMVKRAHGVAKNLEFYEIKVPTTRGDVQLVKVK